MTPLQEAINHKRRLERELNAVLKSFTERTRLTVHEINVRLIDIRNLADDGPHFAYSTHFDIRVDGDAS